MLFVSKRCPLTNYRITHLVNSQILTEKYPSCSGIVLVYFFCGVFLISLGVSTIPLLLEGVKPSADMYHFLFYVDQVLEKKTFKEAFSTIFSQPWARLYSTWLLLLSGTVKIFGKDWLLAIAVVNIICHSLAITLMAILVFFSTKKIMLTILISILLTFSVDILIRVNWAISDSWFLFTATAAFVMTGAVFFKPKNVCLVIAAIVAVIVAGLTRPHGLSIFVVGISAILWRGWFSRISSTASLTIFAVLILGMFSSFVLEAFIFSPSYAPMTTEDSMLQDDLLKGMVLEGVYSTYQTGTEHFLGRLITIVDRYITFFSFFPPHWSMKHILLSSVIFLPWYVSFISCWIMVGSKELDPRIRCLILYSTIWILSISAYAGWSHVTYEYRYRLPLMPIFAFQVVLCVYLLVPIDTLMNRSKKWGSRIVGKN